MCKKGQSAYLEKYQHFPYSNHWLGNMEAAAFVMVLDSFIQGPPLICIIPNLHIH